MNPVPAETPAERQRRRTPVHRGPVDYGHMPTGGHAACSTCGMPDVNHAKPETAERKPTRRT